MDRAALLHSACVLPSAVEPAAAAGGAAGSEEASRQAVVAAVERGEWTMASLVADMAAILTSQQAEVRQRGLRLVHAALTQLSADALRLHSQPQVDALATFLTQRTSDERSLPARSCQHAQAAPAVRAAGLVSLCSLAVEVRSANQPLTPLLHTASGRLALLCATCVSVCLSVCVCVCVAAAFESVCRVCCLCCAATGLCCRWLRARRSSKRRTHACMQPRTRTELQDGSSSGSASPCS